MQSQVNIALPDIDLSKIHKPMPDVVVDVKPLLSFNHSGLDLLTADQVKAGGLAGIGKGGNTRYVATLYCFSATLQSRHFLAFPSC